MGGQDGSRSSIVRPLRVAATISGVVALGGVRYAEVVGLVEPGDVVWESRESGVREPSVKEVVGNEREERGDNSKFSRVGSVGLDGV